MTKKKPFADLRAFIDFLRQEDRLKSISGADWNLELGGLTELVWRKKGEDCPALLFDNIKGYPSGYRVMTLGVASTYHYMAAMNLQPTADRRTAVRALKELVAPEAVTPREVSTGPILENNITGADLDVTMFPAPKFKEDEGGRYIGTGNLVFTRDATTGELNMGTYRVQVHGPDKVTVSVAPGHHGGVHIDSYLSQGQPAPILISLGQAPDLFLSSIEEFPYGVNELEMVGGRRGEPVEIIKGETTGLPMPASAEIVLEGHMYPDAELVESEGPFGEFYGYYAGRFTDVRPITVERIYHRNDPIIFALPHHRPPQDVILEYKIAPRLWRELERSAIPGIHEVNSLPVGSGAINVVSMTTEYPGHSTQVGLHVAASKTGYLLGLMTIIVDEDIDVYDQDYVLWAVLTRCNPTEQLHIVDNMLSFPLDPMTHAPEKKAVGDTTRGRWVIDATRPFHWKDKFPKTTEIRTELKTQLLEKWREFFAEL